MPSFKEIKSNKAIKTYIQSADDSLAALGYTEHGFAHVEKVSTEAARILDELGFCEHTVELAKIAGYLHDIGNLVNRVDHSQSGAILAFRILDKMNMDAEDIATISTAIGNHDEGTGIPVSPVAAALIIADKSDVRRSRVRNPERSEFDIHDRVNFSVVNSHLNIKPDTREIELCLTIDTAISAVMNYFEIFLERMKLCEAAAKKLDTSFRLTINNQEII